MSAGLKLLIGTDVGTLLQQQPPIACPFAMPKNDDARLRLLTLQQVPERLRALLHAVTLARGDLNSLNGADLKHLFGMNSFCLSAKVDIVARTLDDELRQEMGLVTEQMIEYEADWRFCVTSLDNERSIWEREERPKEKTEPDGGLDYSYRKHPPETSPVCFHINRQPEICPHAATLDMAVARTRAKRKPAA